MKRILSVLLALVMVIGMLPMGILSASAAEVTETIAIAATTGTLASDSLSISWTSGSLTFTANKNTSSSAIRTTDTSHFRLYVGFSATLTCSAGNITKIVMTASGSDYAIAPTGSDGSVGTVSGTTITIVPTASSNTYTIPNITKQTRITSIAVTYSNVDASACAHTNTEEVAAKEATCLLDGNTAGVKCVDCGTTISGNETIAALGHSEDAGVVTEVTCTTDGYTTYTCSVCGNVRKGDWVDSTGHSYVDGVCSVCSVALPTDLDGKYYIAAIRSSGDYFYLTNEVNDKDRYVAVDSGLTELPESIETVVDAQVFELIYDATTYTYKIKTGDNYLGWSSGNTGALVDEATAIAATIESAENAYNIHFTATDAERYLALNSSSGNDYFVWYKQGQAEDLYLVPVSETATACEHTNTTTEGAAAATCTTAGSTGTVVCSDCGATVTEATEIAALGHTYVEGVCSVCGEAEPVTNPTATISFATTDQRVSQDTSSQVWSNGGLTVTNNKSASTSNIIDSSNPVRFYKSSELIFAFPGLNKIEVTCNNASYATALGNSISDSNATVTVSDKLVTIELANAVDSFTIAALSAQVRVDSVTVYGVAGACAHEMGEWTTTVEATCETDGAQTATCSKCGESQTKEISATGHNVTYNTETGLVDCSNCNTSFIHTIAEAKAYTDAEKVYYMKGIVTYVSGQTVYMQDATGAICVYFTDADNAAGIAVGDELLVMDALTTYKGLIETTYTTSTEIQILSNGNELPVQTVTVADLNADTTNEYLGERVTITGLTIGMINSASTTTLTDADGNTINLYKASGLASNVTENDIVTVTAIVSAYNSYQLIVNPGTAATDVVVTTEGVPSDLELSTIATAKAGTEAAFYKVKGIVTFVDGASVYMQDETAGIVARLATGVTAPAIGTEIEATGAYTTYYGLIQLEGANFTEVSTDNTVTAKDVTVTDLTSAENNAYLSEKISLEKVTITAVGTYNTTYCNVDYTVSDGTNTIKLYRVPVATAEAVLAKGDVINVVAIVSTYNGYQLRVAAEDDIQVVPAVAAIGETQYYSFADAYAAATAGQTIKLLADCGEDAAIELAMDKNLYVDLNGWYLDLNVTANGYTIYGMDSANAEYNADACGTLVAAGATVAPTTNNCYLAVADGENTWSFHAYSVKLTHVSLDPTSDALGYKAQILGDEVVMDNVTGFGFHMGVEGGQLKTYSKSGKPTNGVFTLRLKNIMASNGGEMSITADAFVIFGSTEAVSGEYSTTMKDTILAVNDMSLSDAQKTAVYSLYAKYSEVMDAWFTAEGKTNNIVGWAPATTEE